MLLGTKFIDPPDPVSSILYPVSAILSPVIKEGLKQGLEYVCIKADDSCYLFC